MKKTVDITIITICSILLLVVSASCNQPSSKKSEGSSESYKNKIVEQHTSSGEIWLNSIFQCDVGSGFCFPDEERVTTDRYYEFFIETIGIYEYPTFETEDERLVAEEAYKNKWKDIYPLEDVMLYPFGRGNGTEYGDHLRNVVIITQSETEYTVLIDYGIEMNTITEVTLVRNGDGYLIDYMKSEYIE